MIVRPLKHAKSLSYRAILALALPVMLANLSTPLIGFVDTAIMGQLPDPAYIGAVAIGALIFTFVFWAFGFLRMGTTGFTAQALGAGDNDEIVAGLVRALVIAAVAGIALIVLAVPIRELAFWLLGAPREVEALAREYFAVRIWAAPFALANYAFIGWFVGLARTRIALVLQLVLNLANALLDAVLVIVFGLDVTGVALGTVMAECLAAVVGAVVAWRWLAQRGLRADARQVLSGSQFVRMLRVNRDIMLRSLALIFAFNWFMAQGARFGETLLAANAVLIQFVSFGAFFLDGVAHAAESLAGQAIGARDRIALLLAARRSTALACLFALAAALAIALTGTTIIDWLTVDPATRSAAREYLPWAAVTPLLGVWAFQLDGLFVGATRGRDMRDAMLLALALYLAAWWLLQPWDNHGLWAAFALHYVARAATLGRYLPRLLRAVG